MDGIKKWIADKMIAYGARESDRALYKRYDRFCLQLRSEIKLRQQSPPSFLSAKVIEPLDKRVIRPLLAKLYSFSNGKIGCLRIYVTLKDLSLKELQSQLALAEKQQKMCMDKIHRHFFWQLFAMMQSCLVLYCVQRQMSKPPLGVLESKNLFQHKREEFEKKSPCSSMISREALIKKGAERQHEWETAHNQTITTTVDSLWKKKEMGEVLSSLFSNECTPDKDSLRSLTRAFHPDTLQDAHLKEQARLFSSSVLLPYGQDWVDHKYSYLPLVATKLISKIL